MKQLLFMLLCIGGGFVGAIVHPFFGIVPYYLFALIQPQHLWHWALPSDVRWSLLAGLAVLVAVVLHLPRLLARVRANAVGALMALYALLIVLCCLAAYDTAVAAHWAQVYLKVLLMAGVTMLVIERFEHVRMVAWLIALSTGYLAWYFNSLYLLEGRIDILNSGLGGFDNNGAALLIGMGAPFAYALAHDSRRLWLRLGWAAAAVLIVHAVMLSYSRGAMVAVLVAGAWQLFGHRPRARTIGWAAAAVVVVLALAGTEVRREFLSVSDYDKDASIQARIDSWGAAMAMVSDHPVLGMGVRNSNIYSLNYGADRTGRTIHSQYLQIAADAGLPALAVYLAMSAAAVWSLRRARGTLLARSQRLSRPAPRHAPRSARAAEAAQRLQADANLLLATEASLLAFFCGALFLSLETFELHWLLLAVAGVAPGLVLRSRPRDRRAVTQMPRPTTAALPAQRSATGATGMA